MTTPMGNWRKSLESRGDMPAGSWAYKLQPGQYAIDISFTDKLAFNENEMSLTIPFADGNRRDGVGDLLEIGGIDCERHRLNPICLYDHGKAVTLPIGLAEDRKTSHYTVKLDPIDKVGILEAFFYQGKGLKGVDKTQEYDHAVFCEQLYDLAVQGYVRGGSIGYQVKAARELPADHTDGTPKGMHLLSTLMLEGSLVVMPANMDTVRTNSKGLFPDLREALALPVVRGKPLSPYLVKSLSAYAEPKKVQLGYEGKTYPGVKTKAAEKVLDTYKGCRLVELPDGTRAIKDPFGTVLKDKPDEAHWKDWVDTYMNTGTKTMSPRSAWVPRPQLDNFQLDCASMGVRCEQVGEIPAGYEASPVQFRLFGDNLQKIDIIASRYKGIAGDLQYRVVKSPDGKWKIVGGQDEVAVPVGGKRHWDSEIEADMALERLAGRMATGMKSILDDVTDKFYNALKDSGRLTGSQVESKLSEFNPAAVQQVISGLYRRGFVKREKDESFRISQSNLKDILRQELSSLGLKSLSKGYIDLAMSVDSGGDYKEHLRREQEQKKTEINKKITSIKDEIRDWQSRQYKPNSSRVTVGGEYGSDYSIGVVNEGKRQRRLDSLNRELQELESELRKIDNRLSNLKSIPVPLQNLPDTKIPPVKWKPGLGATKKLRGKYKKAQPSDDISPEKARQILKDGEANGKPLTEKQRGMFGAAAGKKSLSNELSIALHEYQNKADEDAESGVVVWFSENPKRVVIDVMDWGDSDLAKQTIGKTATRLVGNSNIEWHNEQPPPDGINWIKVKSLPATTVRKKYRRAKGLRRRLKSSSPGASVMWVEEKDLATVNTEATNLGLKFAHVGTDGSLRKIKLIGDDGNIDALALKFGRTKTKHLNGDSHMSKKLTSQKKDLEIVEDAPLDNPADLNGDGIVTEEEQELYSMQLIRRAHEDFRLLLEQYDEMNEQNEHEDIKQHFVRLCEDIVTKIEELEGLAAKHHPEAKALDGGDEEIEVDVEESPDEELEGIEEAEPTDSAEVEEPTPEEALEGMDTKSLRNKYIKALRKTYKKEMGCGKDCDCAKCKGKKALTEDEAAAIEGELEQVTDDLAEDVASTEGEKALEPHEHSRVGEAAEYLKELGDTYDYTREHQMKSYHHAKAMEEVGGGVADDDMDMMPEGSMGVAGTMSMDDEEKEEKSQVAGDLDWLKEEEAEAEHKDFPNTDSGCEEGKKVPLKHEKSWHKGGMASPRRLCKTIAKFLKTLAEVESHEYGQPHRDEARSHAEALGKALEAVAETDVAEEPMEEIEVGEIGEKNVRKQEQKPSAKDKEGEKALRLKVEEQNKQLARQTKEADALARKLAKLTQQLSV